MTIPIKVSPFQATLMEAVAVCGNASKAAKYSGVPYDTFTKWLKGTRTPPVYVQNMMSRLLEDMVSRRANSGNAAFKD